MYDYLVVGAGLFGSVFAHQMHKAGKKILVIDKRDHIGGNCYTKEIAGINTHVYGAHIFHTNSQKVWDFITQFAEFNNYIHKVKALYSGKIYPMPINLTTMNQLWGVTSPEEALARMMSQRIDVAPDNMENWCLANIGRDLYEAFVYGYTVKHWKREPRELPASIIQRLPIRFNHDDNYFNDQFQGIPVGGYTPIFEKLLDGIDVRTGEAFEHDWRKYAKKLVYSGPLDALFCYKYGRLPYLTLEFETEIHGVSDYQGTSVVNFSDASYDYTRAIEHSHFEFKKLDRTVVTLEKSVPWHNSAEPYYPVIGNDEIVARYTSEVPDDVIIGGRLGRHKYFDMHQVIADALTSAAREVKR